MRSLLNAVFPEGNKISFIFFQPCVVTISRNSNLTIFVTTLTGYIFRFMGEGGGGWMWRRHGRPPRIWATGFQMSSE